MATSEGLDTLQYAWGDVVEQSDGTTIRPPLLVSVRTECIGRRRGLGACLSNALGAAPLPRRHAARGGWHNRRCECEERLGLLNCAGTPRVLYNTSLSKTSARSTGAAASPPEGHYRVIGTRQAGPENTTSVRSPCRNCASGFIAWSFLRAPPPEDGASDVVAAHTHVGPTPVAEAWRTAQVRRVLAAGSAVVRRVRGYLSAVYPAGGFARREDVSDEAAVAMFVSRVWFYALPAETVGGEEAALPLDALSARLAGCYREDCTTAARCTAASGLAPYSGLLQLSQERAHRGDAALPPLAASVPHRLRPPPTRPCEQSSCRAAGTSARGGLPSVRKGWAGVAQLPRSVSRLP